MARQKGPIKIEGTIGDLTFLKTQDGYMVKEKSAVSASRIHTDPKYARTRENMSEFKTAAAAGKLIYSTIRTFNIKGADNRMFSRLLSRTRQILATDTVNVRGTRQVADGDLSMLAGMEFNRNAPLANTLKLDVTSTIDRVTGEIEVQIPAFVPIDAVSAPKGATHFRIVAMAAGFDFKLLTKTADAEFSNYLPWDVQATTPLTLTCSVEPNTPLPLFLCLGVEFYQEMNGAHYLLSNGSYNAFAIIKTDA